MQLIALLIALAAGFNAPVGTYQGAHAGTIVSVSSSVSGVPAMRPADTAPPHP